MLQAAIVTAKSHAETESHEGMCLTSSMGGFYHDVSLEAPRL
jgi:hypothetical protein